MTIVRRICGFFFSAFFPQLFAAERLLKPQYAKEGNNEQNSDEAPVHKNNQYVSK